jgi:multidrug efflux pump subunit AcrA (membrane-fusion protein)
VKLAVDSSHASLRIPTSTLVIDSNGVSVATVNKENRITRTPVKLGRDYGREVEVVSGLTPDAQLVVSPRDDLADGERVIVAKPNKSVAAP